MYSLNKYTAVSSDSRLSDVLCRLAPQSDNKVSPVATTQSYNNNLSCISPSQILRSLLPNYVLTPAVAAFTAECQFDCLTVSARLSD